VFEISCLVSIDRINADGTPSPLEPFLRGQGPVEFPGASESISQSLGSGGPPAGGRDHETWQSM
jgi:hypothetical protein